MSSQCRITAKTAIVASSGSEHPGNPGQGVVRRRRQAVEWVAGQTSWCPSACAIEWWDGALTLRKPIPSTISIVGTSIIATAPSLRPSLSRRPCGFSTHELVGRTSGIQRPMSSSVGPIIRRTRSRSLGAI